jgi:hypothetical protein
MENPKALLAATAAMFATSFALSTTGFCCSHATRRSGEASVAQVPALPPLN